MQKSETVSNKEISNKEISNESVLNKTMSNEADYTEKIKSYLKRLGAGESLKSVRADFVKEFREVDSSEIIKAEQELLKEGTPLTEVQKLCDVHAALFHGMTKEENAAGKNSAGKNSAYEKTSSPMKSSSTIIEQRLTASSKLAQIKGHPLNTFTLENEALKGILSECRKKIANLSVDATILNKLKQISTHYAKKGDLLYPHLKVKYEISGPSDVMWTVDDEIRDELNNLIKIKDRDEEWFKRLDALITRIDEMIYKEANILFPNCAVNYSESEWYDIYRDSKDYLTCFGVENQVWEEAEAFQKVQDIKVDDKEIYMAGGHMSVEQLSAMLNTIPLEISFIDADNINRYFNEGPKVFKRPGMAIDREVFSCHPPKIEQKVRMIIEEFRNGTLDKVPVWMNKNDRIMLVTYMAVRNSNNKYIGTMEIVQDMEFAKDYFKC